MPPGRPRLRANVYVDGFNLSYGCFKNRDRPEWTRYKWLDLARFIETTFPHLEVNRIRYFTAPVKPLPENPDQPLRQAAYLRALGATPHLTIHEGRFARTAKHRPAADPSSFSKPYAPIVAMPRTMLGIIQEEEKGSDVNLASHLLVDGFNREYEIAIVVSNDSDLVEPVRLVKSALGLKVGLFNPRSKAAFDRRGVADDYRPIRLGPIQHSQFPDQLHDEHGTIVKPASW